MKKAGIFLIAGAIAAGAVMFTGCEDPNDNGGGTTPAESTTTQPIVTIEPVVEYSPESEEAMFRVVDFPEHGSRSSPMVTVELTKGDPKDYYYVVLVTVRGFIYGLKPFHDVGLIPARAGEQQLQFSTNDGGRGEDHNAEKIHILLITKDTDPDINPIVELGYRVAPAELDALENKAVHYSTIVRA
jgi:hypothetical protein